MTLVRLWRLPLGEDSLTLRYRRRTLLNFVHIVAEYSILSMSASTYDLDIAMRSR
ncbi:hypothetical protein LC607_19660 [Nostoc sp. CHAB 5824]|nr:hypothetical protein [Nostoc sp. CHAB 5824]